jgi:digeranylgeranylglycerophospholipid reductase
MDQEYDVVIAGAGPSGSEAAKTIASRGYDVAVLESESEEDYPAQSNKSTAGTFPRMMGDFYIPDDVVMTNTDSVVLESQNSSFRTPQAGSVLEFGEFKEYMAEEAQEHGVDYIFDSHVVEPVVEDGSIQGVRYDGNQEVYSDIVIDATGPSAPIAQDEEVGFIDLEPEHRAVGWEYLLDDVELDAEGYADLNDAMMLRLDHDIAPGGYSWIFDAGDGKAKVGLCYMDNDSHSRYADDDFMVLDSLEEWIVEDDRFPEVEERSDIDALERHQGSAHIQVPDQVSNESVMGVGDTVSTVDPLWGEGIDTGMKSGNLAGITALEALGKDPVDTSEEMMQQYDERWWNEIGDNRWERNFMTHLMYRMDNERYDRLLQDMEEADGDALSEVNDGNLMRGLSLAEAKDIPTIAEVGKDRIGKHPAVKGLKDLLKRK